MPHASLPTGIQCLFASHGAGATTRHHHPLPPESCQAQDTTPPSPNQPEKHSSMPRQRTVGCDYRYPLQVSPGEMPGRWEGRSRGNP